jgi:peptide/nickel transport system permease protein
MTINFIIPRLIPGNPIASMLARMAIQGNAVPGGAEYIKEYTRMFGLDGTIFQQYVRYFGQLLRGNLGYSITAFPATVGELILRSLPWTIGLLATVVVLSFVLGTLLGATLGWRRESKAGTALVAVLLGLNQIPYYFLAIILIYLLAFLLPIFPSSGAFSVNSYFVGGMELVSDIIYHAFLPALSIIIVSLAGWTIGMRSTILNTIGEDYVLYAEARGLERSRIFLRYGYRNALLPQVTSLAMSLGFLLTGSMITENIFNYPGLGSLLASAVAGLDYNVMHGIFLMMIVAVLSGNLLIELIYPLIDPRVRQGR